MKKIFEDLGHTFVENTMILSCDKIQRKVLRSGEVGAPESSFWNKKLHDY